MAEPPVLVVHLFTETARTQILQLLKTQKRPPKTQVFLGTYGISRLDAEAIAEKAIPGVHYAPTFHIAREENKTLRAKPPKPPKGSPPLEQAFAGQLPPHPRDPRIPAKNPRVWGAEARETVSRSAATG